MRKSAIVVALTAASVSVAFARPQATYVLADENQVVLDRDTAPQHAGFSRVIYLNNCKATNGCVVRPGGNSSVNNTSQVPKQQSTVQPYAFSDSNWQQVVDCVRQTYAPFNVQVVTERPASGDYHMAIVAGRPQDVQLQSGIGGVSPFSCGFIPNAISFSFANIYGGDVDSICHTVAQETAHSWGLDHKFDNRDPMTYLMSGPSRKSFQNESGRCGEFSARNCQCGGTTMNSFAEVMATFGPRDPTPPLVAITAPTNGQTGLAAGFPIRADLSDDLGIKKAELVIDGRLVNTLTKPPFVWNAPADLANGNHTIKIIATDVGDATAEATVTAAIGQSCSAAAPCAGTDVCVDGRCVAGSGVDGGLGSVCVANDECVSGACGNDGTNGYCVEVCDPAANACPAGFECLASGASGVCWPAEGGGCSSGGQLPATPGWIFLAIAVLFVLRPRLSHP